MVCQDFRNHIAMHELLSHLFLDFIFVALYSCSVEVFQFGQVLLEWKVLIFEKEVNDVA